MTRPQGTRKSTRPDLHTLDDEHGQVIELWSPKPKQWWWAFHEATENDKEWGGPFRTRSAAILDASSFCEEMGISS